MKLLGTPGSLRLAVAAGFTLASFGPALAQVQAQPLIPPAATQPSVTTQALAPAAPATQPAATQPATQPTRLTSRPSNGGATTSGGEGTILPNGMVILNFENASLDAVLSFFSEAGGYTIMKDTTVSGRINLYNRQPMSLDDAFSQLDTVLKEHGYGAVRVGKNLKTLKIAPLEAIKKMTIPVKVGSDPLTVVISDEIITQVIPLRFADATQLKRDLAPLVPSYADLSSNASTNTLILTDTSANVHRIVEIIHGLDTSVSAVSKVVVRQLKYANATSAARLITDVFRTNAATGAQGGANRGGAAARFFGGGGGPGGGGGGGRGGGGGGGGGFGGPGGGFGGLGAFGAALGGAGADDSGPRLQQPSVTASADDRTNTVVVSAPADMMPIIEDVLDKLDSDPASNQAVFTYRLRYGQAVNVQNVINSLFGTGGGVRSASTTGTRTTSTGFGSTSTGGTTGGRTGGTTGGRSGGTTGGSSFGSFGSGTGTAGGTANRGGATGGGGGAAARLSSGSAQTAADLAGQIYAVADQDTNSILIMTSSANFERVKLILADLDRPIPQVLMKVLLAEVTHSNDTDLGIEFSAINLPLSGKSTVFTNFGHAADAVATGSTPGGLVYKLVETDVTAAIAALQRQGKIDVLSRPYILGSDNQTASIIVGETVPFITDSRLDVNNNTINTVQYQDIGIILNITPHINPDGVVVMDVAPEISAREDATNSVQISPGVNAPVFTKRAAQTRVAIHDGQTIVIGGLMQDQKSQTINKVPFLGDIPGLGLLFQRRQNSVSKTELLIFLTPHVAQDPGVLPAMSQDEKNGAVIVPQAVGPGVFEDHMKGMERGGAGNAPAAPLPEPLRPSTPAPTSKDPAAGPTERRTAPPPAPIPGNPPAADPAPSTPEDQAP